MEPRCRGWAGQVRRALEFVRPYRRATVAIVLLGLTVAALGAIEPLVLKLLIDGLGDSAPGEYLLACVVGLVVLELSREGVAAVNNWLHWRVRLAVHYGVLEATVDRLHALPVAFHRKNAVGNIMTRVDRGINGFVTTFSEIATSILPAVAYLALSVSIMARMDWRLTLVVLAFTPLPALLGAHFATEQTRRERILLERWARIYSRFNEVLSGIVTVKSFTMEEEEKRRFLGDVGAANGVVVKGVVRDSGATAAKNFVGAAARIAAIGVGGWFVLRGELTVGGLVAFLGYVGGLFGPVQGLTNVYQTLRRASVSLDTIYEILDTTDALGDAPDARPLVSTRGDVAFDRVRFAYADRTVLDGVTFQARAGQVTALVGPSGSGKSTLMALLQRLYDPTDGRILLDGEDIRRFKQRDLRSQIGIVLQDALLFQDTVRNNIAYGRPGASQAEIEAAARAANVHDFIISLPEGYDTLVGERGSRLSGGERQRVAIARALLKNPPILILDEATSALDAESEALVQEALARLLPGRTTFIIAHRLATVTAADQILVLRDGRIEEQGTHEALMERSGYYASLVAKQSRALRGAAA